MEVQQAWAHLLKERPISVPASAAKSRPAEARYLNSPDLLQLEQYHARTEESLFEKNLPGISVFDETGHHRRQAMITLSERILRAKSATKELELWCGENRIGNGQIVAFVETDAASQALDDESLDALDYPEAPRLAKFRQVRLATAGIVVVNALNWYVPGNLTPDMNQKLLTTDVPFGHVVAPLQPWRRTFFVRRYMSSGLAESWSSKNCGIAFEHRAVVRAAGGAPLAVVHERFLQTLF